MKPINGIAPWGAFAVALAGAPFVFNGNASVTTLCQICTAMIFGLSYNMLLGQGGMLSFGHAVYSGLGAFFAVHAMNRAVAGDLSAPLTLVPLIGGLAGLLFGGMFGYLTTRKSGTPFAMISLGIVELVFASSLMLPEFFGGEGGIATNRVYGSPAFGIRFGSQTQVYFLIAAWLFACTLGMYAFTRTPLGRIVNAVRDNPERVEFIGYDAQRVRYLTLMLSSFFAGISGALAAINFEVVTAENVSVARSGAVLLFTFIGGAGHFCGPMVGAAVGVLLTGLLSELTPAWQMYLGVFFIAMVMFAPGGLAGLLMQLPPLARGGRWRSLLPVIVQRTALALATLAGFVLAIEMLYHVALQLTQGSTMMIFGLAVDTASPATWLAAAVLLSGGSWGLQRAGRPPRATEGEPKKPEADNLTRQVSA